MNQAIGGGTNGRAPIGYLNVRKRDELGRELRTIELDPERAPMIEWAFKAYASGDWSVSQLHDELTSRGLRSLPTPKRPATTPTTAWGACARPSMAPPAWALPMTR